MISINNKKRNILKCYEMMVALKSSESVIKGQAEKFNEAGEQVSYRYDIEQVRTIDYDRNEIKKKVSQLRKELNETSDMIDSMQIQSMVDYESVFEIGESLVAVDLPGEKIRLHHRLRVVISSAVIVILLDELDIHRPAHHFFQTVLDQVDMFGHDGEIDKCRNADQCFAVIQRFKF